MSKNQLVGTWILTSFTAKGSNGEEFYPWGENPLGQLIYTAEGQMAVVLTRAGRPRFVSSDPFGGTPEEIKEAFEGMEAYAGTFEVNDVESYVVHHTVVCRVPNWEGGTQIRYFKLQSDQLVLSTPPVQARGAEWVFTFVWCKNGGAS